MRSNVISEQNEEGMSRHSILGSLQVYDPFIILFGLYVQFHGDFASACFQAGVIIRCFVLYGLIFSIENARKVVPAWATRVLLAFGVLLYGGTALQAFSGGNFLATRFGQRPCGRPTPRHSSGRSRWASPLPPL